MPSRAGFIGLGVLVLIVALVAIGLIRAAPNTSTRKAAPLVGHPAPSFSLENIKGRQVSVRSVIGHVALINFWATWCVPCRAEMPVINRLQRAHPRALRVLEVDESETKTNVKSYLERYRLSLVPLLDSSGAVGYEYRVAAQPVTFWLDRNGFIRAIHYGAMSASYAQREFERLSA